MSTSGNQGGYMISLNVSSKIVRLNGVKQLTGLSRATIYKMMRADSFPRQVKLTGRSVGWFERDIVEWNEARKTS